MSHFHQGFYSDTKHLISYINGFLWTLEILNEYTDHGQTYYVEEIQRVDNYETAILNHLDNVSYKMILSKTDNWKTVLQETSKSFFEAGWFRLKHQLKVQGLIQSSFDDSFRDTLDFDLLNTKYLELMEELIIEKSLFFEVLPLSGEYFYKNHYRDFLVDNEKGLFFIHFGETD